MKQCEFENFAESEQLDYLQEEGVYIGKRKQGKHSVLLYQLDDFYVEVYYRKYRCYIAAIRCFTSTVLLEPYLEQVDIEPLGFVIV
jgi:hypothetical protein